MSLFASDSSMLEFVRYTNFVIIIIMNGKAFDRYKTGVCYPQRLLTGGRKLGGKWSVHFHGCRHKVITSSLTFS